MDMDSPKRRRMSRSKSPKRSKVSKRSKSPKRRRVAKSPKRSKSPKRRVGKSPKRSKSPKRRVGKSPKRSKSPKRRVSRKSKSPKRKSPSPKKISVDPIALLSCNGLSLSDCRSRPFCSVIDAHNKKGKQIESFCRKKRVGKKSPKVKKVRKVKSPKAKSACQLMSKSHCVSNVNCGWIKRHLARPGGKMLPSGCRGVRRKSL